MVMVLFVVVVAGVWGWCVAGGRACGCAARHSLDSSVHRRRHAGAVDVLLTCLPAPPDVVALMEGSGVLRALRPGAVWIAHETTVPEEAERFGALSGARGVRMLEAPLTGGACVAAAAALPAGRGTACAFVRIPPCVICFIHDWL